MKTLRFKKDGSNQIKLNGKWYRPLTLEQVLHLESAFYAGTAGDEIEQPIKEWFNYRGFTYIKA